MAQTESVNRHLRAIRQALLDFATSRGIDAPDVVVRVWPSAWADNVHAVVSIPFFDTLRPMERQNEVWEYLKVHLSPEHRSRLSSLQTLSTDEWARAEEEPVMDLLDAA